MKKLNQQIILSNIKEAREELERLEKELKLSNNIDEVELEIGLRHAYHHLNTAWNVRYTETKIYSDMSEENFNKWGLFPQDFDNLVRNDK